MLRRTTSVYSPRGHVSEFRGAEAGAHEPHRNDGYLSEQIHLEPYAPFRVAEIGSPSRHVAAGAREGRDYEGGWGGCGGHGGMQLCGENIEDGQPGVSLVKSIAEIISSLHLIGKDNTTSLTVEEDLRSRGTL